MKKRLIYVFLIMLVFLPLLVNYLVARSGQKDIVRSMEEIKPVQTAIILGAKVYPDGRVSVVLGDRLQTGIELYKAGKVKKILLTGDHGQTNYDEVNAMRSYAMSSGIPAQDIFMDHAGFSTYDSLYRARDIFGVQEAVIVTQQFHLPRAVFTANKLGLKATGLVADKTWYQGAKYLEAREVLARFKAFLQLYIVHSKPKYLGPAIPINGDGRATWDKEY